MKISLDVHVHNYKIFIKELKYIWYNVKALICFVKTTFSITFEFLLVWP